MKATIVLPDGEPPAQVLPRSTRTRIVRVDAAAAVEAGLVFPTRQPIAKVSWARARLPTKHRIVTAGSAPLPHALERSGTEGPQRGRSGRA